MSPNWSGVIRNSSMKYSGSTAVSISDETSVNRLVRPSRMTLRLTPAVPSAVNRRLNQEPGAWSRTVMYTTSMIPQR